jgi:hypothetical protein
VLGCALGVYGNVSKLAVVGALLCRPTKIIVCLPCNPKGTRNPPALVKPPVSSVRIVVNGGASGLFR